MNPQSARVARLKVALAALAALPFLLSGVVRADDRDPQQGFKQPFIFGGVDGGLSTISPSSVNEGDKSGSQFDLKVLGSVYWHSFVLDLGLGWQYNNISGTNSISQTVTITTRSGFIELAPRYRLTDNIQIGPTLDVGFGTDLSFAPDTSTLNQNSAIFGGVQALYDFALGSTDAAPRLRLGARWVAALDIPDRRSNGFQGSVQIGFPLTHSASAPEAAPSPVPTPDAAAVPPAEPAPVPALPSAAVDQSTGIPVAAADEKPDLKILLGIQLVHFDTNKSTLRERPRKILEKLGKFLAEHPDAWGQLRIEGHTDQRGSYKYNLKLSYKRADAVKSALVKGGAPASKLQAQGFSMSHPRVQGSGEEVWAKNRRVELKFFNVPDPGLIKNAITDIENASRE